jgi:hypothetical protein
MRHSSQVRWLLAALLVSTTALGCVHQRNAKAASVATRAIWCGRQYSVAPTLEPDSIGPLRLSHSFEAIRILCSGGRDTFDLFAQVPALAYYAFGATIVVRSDAEAGSTGPPRGRVREILVLGGSLRTKEGLGVGSTAKDIRSTYGPLEVFSCGGLVEAVNPVYRPGLTFVFHLCNADRMSRTEQPADSLRAIGVTVFTPIGAR